MGHEKWCPFHPESGYTNPLHEDECLCAEVPSSEMLKEVRAMRAEVATVKAKAIKMNETLDNVLMQVSEIVNQAKPALDQVMNSPLLQMLSGGKKK